MKIAIFDFDGVIADSHNAVIEAMNEISRLKKVATITRFEMSEMSTKQLLRRLKIRWYEIPFYYKLARKIVYLNKNHIMLKMDILKAFKNINIEDIKFIILSSNSKILITEFIQKNLSDISFLEIIGDVSLFNKARKIKKLISKYGKNKNDFIYIGDEVRDLIAARKANIQSIAVLWGKESEHLLLQENPTYIAKCGDELSFILNKFIMEK